MSFTRGEDPDDRPDGAKNRGDGWYNHSLAQAMTCRPDVGETRVYRATALYNGALYAGLVVRKRLRGDLYQHLMQRVTQGEVQATPGVDTYDAAVAWFGIPLLGATWTRDKESEARIYEAQEYEDETKRNASLYQLERPRVIH